LRRVSTLDGLDLCWADSQARRERLECAPRWTPLTRAPIDKAEGFVELGELCRVHRGQVMGANRVRIAGLHSADLPESVLFHSVTKARELFAAKDVLAMAEPHDADKPAGVTVPRRDEPNPYLAFAGIFADDSFADEVDAYIAAERQRKRDEAAQEANE